MLCVKISIYRLRQWKQVVECAFVFLFQQQQPLGILKIRFIMRIINIFQSIFILFWSWLLPSLIDLQCGDTRASTSLFEICVQKQFSIMKTGKLFSRLEKMFGNFLIGNNVLKTCSENSDFNFFFQLFSFIFQGLFQKIILEIWEMIENISLQIFIIFK